MLIGWIVLTKTTFGRRVLATGGNRDAAEFNGINTKNVKLNKENIYRNFKHLSLSFDEFNKLCIDYTKQQIDDILEQMENYRKNKDYTSLYLTAKEWLSRNKTLQVESISPEEEKARRLGFLKPNK